jgi:glycosyltransferase involved in cell wall biosynthesis
VQRLASDPALATRLAAAARSLALGEYTREICARRFSALYTRLTGIDPARLGAAALEEVKIGK